jgi:hypothetical protein
MSLIRTTIYLDEKQLERLREKCERDKTPVAEIVRRAVDAFLAWNDPNYQPSLPQPQIRKSHSSPP